LHSKNADAFAVRYAGETIRDADSNSFLTANDGPDASCRGGFDQGIGRIAAQEFDSFTLKDFANRIHNFH
jgi:hypothetical protein